MCVGRNTPFASAVLAALVFCSSPFVLASGDKTRELDELRASIAQVQHNLDRTREARDTVREGLRDAEREISLLLASLREINGALRTETRHLEQLQRQQKDRQALLARQRQELAQYARVAYMLGNEEPLKLILNQEDPARAGRMLIYHRYFAQTRAQRIRELQTTLQELSALEPEIRNRTRQLSKLRDAQLAKKRVLEQSRSRERALMVQLGRRIESRAQQIARLRADEARLSRLVEGVRESVRSLPAPIPGGARFADFRGRLPLPVSGKLAGAKSSGDHKWKGMLLNANPGQEIHSVFPGRVVYADWLQGLGLLLILEHGEGYMTLYGHGQSLYKKVGDWVEAGEAIGQTGKTGGFPGPGLYFEIRHNGEPRNPLEWCRRVS